MVKLNLGCGPHSMMDWINYDVVTVPGSSVIRLDLSHGSLPHVDNSVDFIFCEHFIEHITREQTVRLFRDCWRVLKPEGRMRVSTPDLAAWASDYLAGKLVRMDGVWEPSSPCAMLNEGLRLWGHQFLYDELEISSAFREAGFSHILRKDWHQSAVPVLRGLEVRPFYNDLIVESIKG